MVAGVRFLPNQSVHHIEHLSRGLEIAEQRLEDPFFWAGEVPVEAGGAVGRAGVGLEREVVRFDYERGGRFRHGRRGECLVAGGLCGYTKRRRVVVF